MRLQAFEGAQLFDKPYQHGAREPAPPVALARRQHAKRPVLVLDDPRDGFAGAAGAAAAVMALIAAAAASAAADGRHAAAAAAARCQARARGRRAAEDEAVADERERVGAAVRPFVCYLFYV